MKKIFISTSSFGKDDRAPLDLLDKEGISYELNPYGRKLTINESKELLQGKDGLIAGTETLNGEIFSTCDNLKVISRCGTGMDAVDLKAAEQFGIKVYNTPTVHVDAVAELTIAGILALARKLSLMDSAIRNGEWKKLNGQNISGKTVAIIGFGKVGKKVAAVFNAMGAKVVVYDTQFNQQVEENTSINIVDKLDEIFSQADIITLHVPLTDSSRGILNKAVFSQLKKSVLIANTSRGGLIDEEALYDFLAVNSAAGAYLDVFEDEPYNGALCKLKNTLLSPHIGTSTTETRVNMEVESVVNLIKYFKSL